MRGTAPPEKLPTSLHTIHAGCCSLHSDGSVFFLASACVIFLAPCVEGHSTWTSAIRGQNGGHGRRECVDHKECWGHQVSAERITPALPANAAFVPILLIMVVCVRASRCIPATAGRHVASVVVAAGPLARATMSVAKDRVSSLSKPRRAETWSRCSWARREG